MPPGGGGGGVAGGRRSSRKIQLTHSGVDSLTDMCVDFIIGHLEAVGDVVDDYGRVSLREGVTLPLEICQVCFYGCDRVMTNRWAKLTRFYVTC